MTRPKLMNPSSDGIPFLLNQKSSCNCFLTHVCLFVSFAVVHIVSDLLLDLWGLLSLVFDILSVRWLHPVSGIFVLILLYLLIYMKSNMEMMCRNSLYHKGTTIVASSIFLSISFASGFFLTPYVIISFSGIHSHI